MSCTLVNFSRGLPDVSPLAFSLWSIFCQSSKETARTLRSCKIGWTCANPFLSLLPFDEFLCKSLEIVEDLDPCFRFYDDFRESLPFCKVGRLSLANSSSFIHWITIQMMMMMMNTKGDCGCLYCGDLATCMVHTTQWLGQFCL